jgi:hypothetical protein
VSLSWAVVAQAGVKAVLGIALSGCRPPWPLTFAGSGRCCNSDPR